MIALELLETRDIVPRNYMDSDLINIFKSPFTRWCVTRRERVKTQLTIRILVVCELLSKHAFPTFL